MAGLLMVHSVHMLHELVNTEEPTGRREFVEHFALLLDEAGMPRMPARVFAAILADDAGRLTARELAERLSVSPAAVSGAVRYLAQAGMVERGASPAAARDHYRLHDDLWYETYAHRGEMLRRWEQAMAEGVAALGPSRRPGAGSRRRASSSRSCARSCRR